MAEAKGLDGTPLDFNIFRLPPTSGFMPLAGARPRFSVCRRPGAGALSRRQALGS